MRNLVKNVACNFLIQINIKSASRCIPHISVKILRSTFFADFFDTLHVEWRKSTPGFYFGAEPKK